MNSPIPLRPDPGAIAERSRRSLSRALLAHARAYLQPGCKPHQIIERTWSHDDGASLVLRAATTPHSTSDAALLVPVVEAAVLGATGAGAALLRRGLVLNFGSAASIALPVFVANATFAGFVGQGAPIPVVQPNIDNALLEPRKLTSIFVLTKELIAGSNAETVITECVKRSIGLSLDQHLFDAVATDALRPAGLRNGVSAATASVATDPAQAMVDDIKTLAAAVGVLGGEVVLIANPARAMTMPAQARGGTLPAVLGSPAVAADDLIAVAADALAAVFGPEIVIDISDQATLHMEDTTPLAIGTAGTPNAIAAPVRSLFQTDGVGMRLRLQVSWARRHPASVAWLTTTAW